MLDVGLCALGERVAESIAVMVQAVSKQTHARRRHVLGERSPGDVERAAAWVLEPDVEGREVFQRVRGGVRRDAPRAIGDATPRPHEILHQQHEGFAVGILERDVHLGNAEREVRCEPVVEQDLLDAHPAGGDHRSARRIEREHLAEHRVGRRGSLRFVIRDPQERVRVGDLAHLDDLDGLDPDPRVLGREGSLEPCGRDAVGSGGRLGGDHALLSSSLRDSRSWTDVTTSGPLRVGASGRCHRRDLDAAASRVGDAGPGGAAHEQGAIRRCPRARPRRSSVRKPGPRAR